MIGWGQPGLHSEFTAGLCCIDSVKSFTQKKEKEKKGEEEEEEEENDG